MSFTVQLYAHPNHYRAGPSQTQKAHQSDLSETREKHIDSKGPRGRRFH